ncbi:uncharacterized protein LOC106879862 [Argonauta hians]
MSRIDTSSSTKNKLTPGTGHHDDRATTPGTDDETPVCENFAPQTWRKTICRNCFHSKNEHDGDTRTNGTDNLANSADARKTTSKKENEKENSCDKNVASTTNKNTAQTAPKVTEKQEDSKNASKSIADLLGTNQPKKSPHLIPNATPVSQIMSNLANNKKPNSGDAKKGGATGNSMLSTASAKKLVEKFGGSKTAPPSPSGPGSNKAPLLNKKVNSFLKETPKGDATSPGVVSTGAGTTSALSSSSSCSSSPATTSSPSTNKTNVTSSKDTSMTKNTIKDTKKISNDSSSTSNGTIKTATAHSSSSSSTSSPSSSSSSTTTATTKTTTSSTKQSTAVCDSAKEKSKTINSSTKTSASPSIEASKTKSSPTTTSSGQGVSSSSCSQTVSTTTNNKPVVTVATASGRNESAEKNTDKSKSRSTSPSYLSSPRSPSPSFPSTVQTTSKPTTKPSLSIPTSTSSPSTPLSPTTPVSPTPKPLATTQTKSTVVPPATSVQHTKSSAAPTTSQKGVTSTPSTKMDDKTSTAVTTSTKTTPTPTSNTKPSVPSSISSPAAPSTSTKSIAQTDLNQTTRKCIPSTTLGPKLNGHLTDTTVPASPIPKVKTMVVESSKYAKSQAEAAAAAVAAEAAATAAAKAVAVTSTTPTTAAPITTKESTKEGIEDNGDNMASNKQTARYNDEPRLSTSKSFTSAATEEVKNDGQRCVRSHSFEGSNIIITGGQDNEGARDSPGRLSRQDSTSSTSSSSESGRSRQPIVVEVQVRKGHRSAQQTSQPSTGRSPSPAPFFVISPGGATRIGRNPITTTIRTGFGFPSGRMSPSILHSGFTGLGGYADGGGIERYIDSGGGGFASSPSSSCSSPVPSSMRSGYRPFHSQSPSPSPSIPSRVIPLPVLHTTSTGVSPDSYEFNVGRATSPHVSGYNTPPPPPYTPPLDTSARSSTSPCQQSNSEDGKIPIHYQKDIDNGFDPNNYENKRRYEGGKSRDVFVIDNRVTRDKDNQQAQPNTNVQQVSGYKPSTTQQQAEYSGIKCQTNIDASQASVAGAAAESAAAASKYPGKDDITLASSTGAVVYPSSPAAATAVAAPPASISNEGRQNAYSVKGVPSENRDPEPKQSYHETPVDPINQNKNGQSETNTGFSSEEVEKIKSKVVELEESIQKLKDENSKLQNDLNEKSVVEKQVAECSEKLKTMEQKCSDLEEDKKDLEEQVQIEKMKVAKGQLESRSLAELRKLLEESDETRLRLNEENDNLREAVNEMKLEVDEMYDQFRESDAEDFRELQKELEITAKNCRILQFKLRKAERRNDQIETERELYEDKLRNLQDAFEDQDARRHIQALEEELKMAKEVSVRLHDELDIVEEKRSRVEDDNRKLQDMLELSDKKNFRMEMEIDKLRDKIADLQCAMAKLSNNTQDSSPNRKVMLGQLPKQSSSETEPQQLMRELYDTLERENDLKEQMKFTELEAKNMRKKLSDLEEENESLTVQIKKLMSAKTIFTKKPEDSGSAAKEIELNLMLEMSERENAIARKKVAELDHMNDSLQEEVKYLEKRIDEKEQEMSKYPEPTTPNAYYEDKIRELTEQTDELKWKLIEKDREIERLSALVQNINTKQNRLKKSRSLDGDNQVVDLNRQLTHVQQEASILRDKLVKIESENDRYIKENRKLQFQVSHKVPTVAADDAALENVELKALVKKLETDNKELNNKLRMMSEDIRKMGKESLKLPLTPTHAGSKSDGLMSPGSKFTRSSPILGSPTATRTDRIGDASSVSGSKGISINIGSCNVGTPTEGTDKVPDILSANSNQDRLATSRDAEKVKQLQKEAAAQRQKMAELESKNARMSRELNRINSEKLAEVESNSSQLASLPSENMSAEDRVRRELMEEIHDLEDELDDQTKKLREVEEKNIELDLEVKHLTEELSTIKDEFSSKENELLSELHSFQEKYSVLSNLLDIVKERADEAEAELEKFRCSSSTHSARSVSNTSALSDNSVGSDEVFLVPRSPGGTLEKRDGDVVIDKDWEKQFRKRICCLETLLAEERSKLLASEKKLKLISSDIVSTGLSDDAKLHMREKELLQEELLESQKHVRIATDQISGLRERMEILEEENLRLKEDYKRLEIEMTTSTPVEGDLSPNIQRGSLEAMIKKLQDEITTYKSLIKSLENDCAKYKLQSEEYEYKMNNYKESMENISTVCKKYKEQAEELEYKVAELNEIWRSKSAASEKEKESIQIRLKNKILDLRSKEDLLLKLQKTLQVKTVSLTEKERIIKAKEAAISTRDEVIRGLEEIAKQRDNDFQALIEQVAAQDENAKKLREFLRQRDERLREKDDMLLKLNNNIGLKQDEVNNLDNAVRDSITRLSQKEEELKKLRTHISEVENIKTMSETDEQKENTALKNKFTELLISVKRLTDDKEKLSKDLSVLKNNLNDKESKSVEEKNALQMKIRTLNERLTNVTKTAMLNEKDSMRILRQDNQNMIEEKNRLNCEIRNLRQEMDEKQKLLDSQADIAQALESKRKQVEDLAEINKRQQESIDRLESQATLAFQLQQEERVRKAEQLAMKVRYETKIEKLQRDFNQLQINSERVAKERELQQEIIRGVQRGMFNLKDKYTQDRSRWQTDKEKFESQATEAEKGQNKVNQLKNEIEKLQLKIADQDRLILEQTNKFATEKSAWEIDYSSILSEKNQLENQLSSITKNSEDETMSKKLWEKERSEQKRLLTEAHNLAMDLQQQLKTRDEAYSKERKQLLNRLEIEREAWDKKRIELEKNLAELESSGRQLEELKRKYQDLQDTNVKDQQNWLIEKNELVRQVTEQRHRLLKDSRKIEDLLYQLNHIKSLFESGKSAEGEINANVVSRSSKQFSQIIPSSLQEASIIVNTMTDDLTRYIDTKDKEVQSQVRRSLSSTQLELHKELEYVLGPDTSPGFLSPASAGNGITRSHTSDALQKMTVTTSSTDLLSPQLTMSYNTGVSKSRSPSPVTISSKSKLHSVSVIGSDTPSSLSEKIPKNKTLIKSISMDNQEVILSVSHTKAELVPQKTEALSSTTSATSLNLPTSSTLPRMSTSVVTLPSPSTYEPMSTNLPIPTRSVSTDNVSPMTARKQFFTKPSSDYGLSWPRRGAGFGHSRQMSMPDAGEIKVLTSSESKQSVSWNDNVRVAPSEKREIASVSSSTENVLNTKPSGAKEKRRLFKKSSSVDNPVLSSIARVGVQAAQPAAPSIMKPSDLFKAMKQKLRPSFKKTFSFDSNPLKPAGEGSTPTESLQSWGPSASTSPDQLSPDILDQSTSAFHPITKSSVEEDSNRQEQRKEDSHGQRRGHRSKHEDLAVQSDEESDRLGRMIASRKKNVFRKNRSKSADSRHEDRVRPLVVHADVITPIRVWEFNETPV